MQVSVVIPAYNEEKFIRRCLESIGKQSDPPDEIIIVDNYSQDRTAAIAAEFNVKIIREKTRGIGHARNIGFDAVQFPLIARCDADTVVPPDWIAKIKKNFTKPIDALAGPVTYYDALFKTPLFSKIFVYFLRTVLGHFPLVGLNMSLTKEIWLKVRDKVCLDDKKVHEDIDLAMHIHQVKGVVGFDPTLVVFSSGRRINKNVWSFFVEYPVRLIKTLTHKIKQV